MARRRHRGLTDEAIGELNLVPYMDIMVNLVLFMLVNITSFLSFTILNASIPQLAPDSAQVLEQQNKKSLLLMVRVTSKQILVDPSVQGGKSMPRVAIRKSSEGYDFAKLNEMVVGVKAAFPKETKVMIVAERDIRYDDIIQTMDAVRENGPGKVDLFPDVTLSIL